MKIRVILVLVITLTVCVLAAAFGLVRLFSETARPEPPGHSTSQTRKMDASEPFE